MNLVCFQCGSDLGAAGAVGRREECPKCHADVHVCRNCKFYEPKVYNECKEPQAERVQERDRANFCDFFAPQRGPRGANDGKVDLRKAAEALFKKK